MLSTLFQITRTRSIFVKQTIFLNGANRCVCVHRFKVEGLLNTAQPINLTFSFWDLLYLNIILIIPGKISKKFYPHLIYPRNYHWHINNRTNDTLFQITKLQFSEQTPIKNHIFC